MDTPSEPFIFRLPNELLDRIIGETCSTLHDKPWENKCLSWNPQTPELVKFQASLCRVCRRFYPIAMQYLYADLVVQTSLYDWSPGYAEHQERAERVPRRLHRSMKTNPALWPLCRRLLVYYEDFTRPDDPGYVRRANPWAFLVTDYLAWFTGLRSLFFEGVAAEPAWRLVRLALENCPALTELDLTSRSGYCLDLRKVVDLLSEAPCPQLRILGVNGISKKNGPLMSQKLQEKAGTALFTTLRTCSFLQTPSVLEDLVRWPKALNTIKIEHTFGQCYSKSGLHRTWSLATLQPILAIHASTLRRISVRCINIGGLAGLDLRGFPNLEELKLSAQTTTNEFQDYTAGQKLLPNLLAPRLRLFYWDHTLEDQQCEEQLRFFAQAEEDFLRALANAVFDAGLVCFREIRIQFTPHAYVYEPEEIYPWDRMDAVDREVRGRGVRVTYNKPTCTKEEFLKMQEAAREKARMRSLERARREA
ncbi:hypothetical protein BJX64DRAFT_91268 [Aspergillus heterothallicus]